MNALDMRYVFLIVTLSTLGTSYMVYVAWQTEVARHARAYIEISESLDVANAQIRLLKAQDTFRDLGSCREKLYATEVLAEKTYIVTHRLSACMASLDTAAYEIIELQSECGLRR